MANVNSGWYFPEIDPHDDPMLGCWDVNPNVMSELGQQGPTGFGADVKALLCKIYKCTEEEAGIQAVTKHEFGILPALMDSKEA